MTDPVETIIREPLPNAVPPPLPMAAVAPPALVAIAGELLDDAWADEFDRRLAAWEAESAAASPAENLSVR